MLNPDKYIRKAYIDLVKEVTGNNLVWHKMAPKDIVPLPDKYVLIGTQTKQETQRSKPGASVTQQGFYFEWLCSITIDMINVNENHFNSMLVVDDMEELIMNRVRQGVYIDGFSVKNVEYIDTVDLSVSTLTNSIDRKAIVLQHWISEV